MGKNKCVLVLATVASSIAFAASSNPVQLFRPASPVDGTISLRSVRDLMEQVSSMQQEMQLLREQAESRKGLAEATSRLAVYSFQSLLANIEGKSVDVVADDYLNQFDLLQMPPQSFAVQSICLWTAQRYLHDYHISLESGRPDRKLYEAAHKWYSKVERIHVGYELEELYKSIAKEFGSTWDTSPLVGYQGLF